MNAPILMIKKQVNKLHDKMKAIKSNREDEKKQESAPPPPAYPPPSHPPPVFPQPPNPAPRPLRALLAPPLLPLSRQPPPPTVPDMAPDRVVAPFATRAPHQDHPASRPSYQHNNHKLVTDAMPAPLAFHPFKPQDRGHRPQHRKPLAEIHPNIAPRRGVPQMGTFQIPLDPSISLDSVEQYFSKQPQYDDGGARLGRIPTPDIFKKAAKSAFVRRDMDNMDEVFPDFPSKAAETAVVKIKAEREKKKQESDDWTSVLSMGDLGVTLSAQHESLDQAPVSDIGTLQKLPGELRNTIYRLVAVNPSGSIKIILKTGECDQGKCTHREAPNIVPGLANTCRQLRHEIMPIFCAENKTFHFDHRTVAERCTVGYLSTLGSYIDLIQEYKFDMVRPCWAGVQFLGYATYNFTLTTPAASATGQWALHQDFTMSDELAAAVAAVRPPVTVEVICQCELVKMVAGLNGHNSQYGHGSTKGCGLMALRIASAARWADYVYELKKSKQYMGALRPCKDCNKVKFV